MELYNKIMLKVWLVVAIAIFILTTIMCFVDDYRQWVFYYFVSLIALVMFLMKRYMMRRMEKHNEFLQNKDK
jgi:predicted permease